MERQNVGLDSKIVSYLSLLCIVMHGILKAKIETRSLPIYNVNLESRHNTASTDMKATRGAAGTR